MQYVDVGAVAVIVALDVAGAVIVLVLVVEVVVVDGGSSSRNGSSRVGTYS